MEGTHTVDTIVVTSPRQTHVPGRRGLRGRSTVRVGVNGFERDSTWGLGTSEDVLTKSTWVEHPTGNSERDLLFGSWGSHKKRPFPPRGRGGIIKVLFLQLRVFRRISYHDKYIFCTSFLKYFTMYKKCPCTSYVYRSGPFQC